MKTKIPSMKKPFLTFTALFILFLSGINSVKAQSPLDNFTYQIVYRTTSIDTAVFDSLCTRLCKITLTDTSVISKIHVKIGTAENAGDILNQTFLFDVNSGLPNGISYQRNGYAIILGLLNTYKADVYYYELKMEDQNGNLSQAHQWN